MTPTAEQQAIIDAYLTGKDLVIEAGAGSGKTSTLKLVAGANLARRGIYIAYNKAIAEDAKQSFPVQTTCATAHSFAFRQVGRQYAHRLNGYRMPNRELAIALGMSYPQGFGGDAGEPERVVQPQQLARLAMNTVANFCNSATSEIKVGHVPVVAGLDDPVSLDQLQRYILPFARKAWADVSSRDGRLPFIHDHYLKIWQLSGPRLEADYILLDEAQDASPVIADVVERQTHAQRILVGDQSQCQPAGTLITRVRRYRRGNRFTGILPTEVEQVPIEEVQIGDRVISLGLPRSFLRRSGSRIAATSKRPYDGWLIRATTEAGLSSAYTPEHRCVARFGRALTGRWVVYLMRRGGDYRIGLTGGRLESQNRRIGIMLRASQEAADAVWILSVHSTRPEAALAELTAAWGSGIPTVTFRASNRSVLTQGQLDLFWRDHGSNRGRAESLLRGHRRNIDLPLWRRGDPNLQTRRPTLIAACNLIGGMELLPLSSAMLANGKRVSARRWERVEISQERHIGPVFSLQVEGDETYVADGLVTHNSIYSWRGAIDAMREFGGHRLQLSQSFRFGPEVAAEANKFLTLLGASLRLRGYDKIPSRVEQLERPAAILCRSNSGAMARVIDALAAGRRPALVGGGQEIRKLAEAALTLKAGVGCAHPALFAFKTWAEVQEYVGDPANGAGDLKIFVSLIDSHGPEALIQTVDALRDERVADVVISTAHKAKGREWDTVQIGGDFQEPRGERAASDSELMLDYVAVTRAKLVLDRGGLSWINRYFERVTGRAA